MEASADVVESGERVGVVRTREVLRGNIGFSTPLRNDPALNLSIVVAMVVLVAQSNAMINSLCQIAVSEMHSFQRWIRANSFSTQCCGAVESSVRTVLMDLCSIFKSN